MTTYGLTGPSFNLVVRRHGTGTDVTLESLVAMAGGLEHGSYSIALDAARRISTHADVIAVSVEVRKIIAVIGHGPRFYDK